MTDAIDAFHAAIYANPADPLPRLVYADWLDDHDEAEYAELIRLFAEAAGRPLIHHRGGPLRRRQAELYRAVYNRWRLTDLFPGRHWRVRFVDGVAADRLDLSPVELAQAGQWPPYLRPRRLTLLLSSTPGDERHLGGCGYFDRVRELRLWAASDGWSRVEHRAGPWLDALSVCPHVGQLATLHLTALTATDEDLRRFAAGPLAGRLTHFSLWHLTDETADDDRGHPWPIGQLLEATAPPIDAVRSALEMPVWVRAGRFD